MQRVHVWDEIESIVALELGALLGTSLHFVDTPRDRPAIESVIPLTLVSSSITIRIGIGVTDETRGLLADLLLGGDATQEALADALREMANTAGGAVRREALDHGDSFAVGLPSNDNLIGRANAISLDGKHRTWTLSDGNGLELACIVHVMCTRPRRLPPRDLREGMVLARDVFSPIGEMLVPAGTLLTATTVERIVSIVDAITWIDVTID